MNEAAFRSDAVYARELDAQDELAGFRDEFVIADADLIYLDGNSLGRLPKRSRDLLRGAVETQWGEHLIGGWNAGWFEAAERIGAKVARLVGAEADEVVLADSTSVNLFKLVEAALAARPGRARIVTDDFNFPSDLYILQTAAARTGRQLERVPSPDGIHMSIEALAGAVGEDTALLSLSHTAFKSGFTYDLAGVTEMAHRAGALVVWDLSHSVGALPIPLGAAGADLAVGCSYKYLNGGPGAPAFLYVRRDLQGELPNPIAGWFSQRGQFEMALDYEPASGMRRYLTGTPPVLSLLPVEVGVDLLLEAGIERLRAKSIRQTEYLIRLWEQVLQPLGFRLNSPREPARRGAHVSLGHDDALAIDLALIREMKVLPDFRHPDNIRLGLAPMYTTFVEVHAAVQRLQRVVEERLFEKYVGVLPEVT